MQSPEKPRPDAPLPIHFFTIVLNGEPFIRYHLDVLRTLPFAWHWHVVEGVASLVNDTSWSVAGGGRIDDSLHAAGRSNDGASAYLDEIAAAEPGRITLYRKPLNEFWHGKKEMVAAPLPNISEECLLWQIDADELWTATQIETVREKFMTEPERTAAFFWCDYFVGPRALISTRYNYAQNPAQEWLRVWRYKPGDRWGAHEPPTLLRPSAKNRDIARIAPLLHDETEAMGAVFQHFAYVTEAQLTFKDAYYGYRDAVARWRRLQEAVGSDQSVLLRDYFPWVTDGTMVESAARMGVTPIAEETAPGKWVFHPESETRPAPKPRAAPIVIDAVFFQHNAMSGIARFWRALFQEWIKSGFAKRVLILDRGGTAPRIAGLRYRSLPPWDQDYTARDSLMLEEVCQQEGAALFVSTYYTTPIAVPSVFIAHDMIPEVLGFPMTAQIWREKHLAILHASKHVSISDSTARDLVRMFPDVKALAPAMIFNGVEREFFPENDGRVSEFKRAQSIDWPYFLLVGERRGFGGYKNTALFFEAFSQWSRRKEFDIVCVGGQPRLERELAALAPDARVIMVSPKDGELRVAYSGAAALMYPSRYEGFGMPIAEAMACGCPVVTCANSSLAEVGRDAPLYIGEDDLTGMIRALDTVLVPDVRAEMVSKGLRRAAQLDWADTAAAYEQLLLSIDTAKAPTGVNVWRALREEQAHQQAMLAGIPRKTKGAGIRGTIIWLGMRARRVVLGISPDWALPALRRAWRKFFALTRAGEQPL